MRPILVICNMQAGIKAAYACKENLLVTTVEALDRDLHILHVQTTGRGKVFPEVESLLSLARHKDRACIPQEQTGVHIPAYLTCGKRRYLLAGAECRALQIVEDVLKYNREAHVQRLQHAIACDCEDCYTGPEPMPKSWARRLGFNFDPEIFDAET